MPFDPALSVPGSKLSSWTGLRSPTDPSLTTWYHPATGTMVDYNSRRDTFAEISRGTTRRSAVEKTFGSAIRAADRALRPPTTPAPSPASTAAATARPSSPSGSTPSSSSSAPAGSKIFGYYPRELEKTQQDRIKFSRFKPSPSRTIGGATAGSSTLVTGAVTSRRNGDADGAVILGIQGQIGDSNAVDWSGMTLDPIQIRAAKISLDFMANNPGKDLGQKTNALLGQSMGELKNALASKNKEIQILLAQQAVQAQGLLSRLTGQVANPNLELLFNGPTLRPFNFTFRMTPRDADEAYLIKQIIKFFKKGMAVQGVEGDIFLKSPCIFDIEYQVGASGGRHTSLPKIKTCGLIGCDINYTPDGSYMTINDASNGYPMTCYEMTLRFSELEPVYARDYDDSDTDIGY